MSAPTTAADVREALLGRWAPAEYLSIYEAPQDSGRQGRKLDVVVVSLWESRGLELDGVEIKVSMSDWKRELDNPDKADWWWKRVHRFWIAAPAEVAKKIKPQLPTNWGLLSVGANGVRVAVQPTPNRTPEPLAWGTTVGLLRATADCGVNVLARAEQIGYDRGYKVGEANAARHSGDEHLRHRLQELTDTVAEFEKASGLKITGWQGGERIGQLVAMVQAAKRSPDITMRQADVLLDQLANITAGATELRDVLAAVVQPPPADLEQAS